MMPMDPEFTSAVKGKYGVMWRGAAVNGLPKTAPKEKKKRVRPDQGLGR